MAETVIRSRIDSAVKLEAQALLEKLGLSMSEAIRLFLHQVVIEKGLPFEVKLQGEAAQAHDRWFRSQVEAAVKEADEPTTELIPHEKVRSDWDEKKKTLQARSDNEKRT